MPKLFTHDQPKLAGPYEMFKFTKQVDLSDYTLVIPSVSVGNVPQLTADLIVSTYNLKKIASLWHLGIIPAVGADPFLENGDSVCTACELYAAEELKLAVLQLRSGVERRYAEKFFDELRSDIIAFKLKRVFVLSSAFAHEMHDVTSSRYRYESTDDTFDKLNVPRLQEPTIPGGGFAARLYAALKATVPTTLLVKYASEGDNRPDAVDMLNLLQALLANFGRDRRKEVAFPISWEHLFGNPAPAGIY